MSQGKTVILLFAQSALKEAGIKSFRNSAKLFALLNSQTLDIVRKTKLPYFQFTENEQRGSSFGERLTHAIEFAYDQGYDNVIAIGNDTPHLKASHILKTVKKLEKKSLVIGPSKDGGFYLLGLHKSRFDSDAFLQLPWQTSMLADKLMASMTLPSGRKKDNAVLLKPLSDIDLVIDIEAILQDDNVLSNRYIRQVLETIQRKNKSIFAKKESFIAVFLQKLHINKGSPLFERP